MKRRAGLVWVVGVVVPLFAAASAYGQGATLTVSPPAAAPGQVVTVSGTGYNPANAHLASGVRLRLDTRDADPLVTTLPTGQGTISAQFLLPASVAPGEHLLIGTQTTVRGRHTFGTPGRAKLRVLAAGAAASGGAPGGLPPAALGATILSLLALMGGSVLYVRRLRAPARHTQPQFSR